MKTIENGPEDWAELELLCLANIAVEGGRKLLVQSMDSMENDRKEACFLFAEGVGEILPTGWVADLRPLDILKVKAKLKVDGRIAFDPWTLQVPRRLAVHELVIKQHLAGGLAFSYVSNLSRRPDAPRSLSFEKCGKQCKHLVLDAEWCPDEAFGGHFGALPSAWLLIGKLPDAPASSKAILAVI